MYYIILVIFGSLALQILLSRFFKIDTDTTLIVSTTLILSPPFVPAVAAAFKNREIILTGIIAGIVGYSTGNYLGILMSYLLK
jgi:uncharacterized membrane protein